MTDSDIEIVVSTTSGYFTKDGITVEVQIYQIVGEDGWILEVVYDDDLTTIWEEPFDTEAEALEEFGRTVEAEGMNAFIEAMSGTIH